MSVSGYKKSTNGHAPKASRPQKRRAAFYDLDGTLVDLNLVHAAIFTLANVGEWSGRVSYLLGFAARIPRLYVAEQRDRRLLNTALFEAFKGVSRDRLLSLGEEYCERILIGHLFPRAVELIEANREAGIEPVLVTGSPDFIVAPLARHLGVVDFAANRFVFSRGRATGRLAEPVMAGDEKAVWCAEYAAAHDIDLADCWGYADSHYDTSFLAALGHPVAVNPDRRLRAAALSRQWPVLHFEKAADSGPRDDFDHDQDHTDKDLNPDSERSTRGSDGAA
ncbi:MAG TPA: HAD-IB family hydrolase [Candidatus Binatus sp.]|uniref:HAD family hydrolase n=1 Tax=Candidatus Binatus sp. TaxID=2811406 RepID=UPI002F40A3D9